MLNALCLAALLATCMALIVLSCRALRLRRPIARWAGASLAALVAVVCLVAAVLMIAGFYKLQSRYAPVPDIKVTGTPEQIQRGQAIASGFCGACHSSTGTLTGGRDLGQHLPAPIGHFIAANLTPAGPLRRWSDGQIFRAIRDAVDADGHWLMVMSLTRVSRLSDQDTQALIGYLRSLPASGTPTPDPPDMLTPLGLIKLGAGELPTGAPVVTGTIVAPPKAPTAEYGEYILSYHDCRSCHGTDLQGGIPGQLGTIGPNLSVVNHWGLSDFIRTLRTGVDPYGYHLDAGRMPWRAIGKMVDEELGAIYAYLQHLPDP
jgi:mono/diheme cytochrome c family protein